MFSLYWLFLWFLLLFLLCVCRLLTINETILNEIPTIAKMRALFNNYELDSSINEYVSPIERQEENDFIDELQKTPVMRAAMKFLQDKGSIWHIFQWISDIFKIIFFLKITFYQKSHFCLSTRCRHCRSKNAIWLAQDHLVQFILTWTRENRQFGLRTRLHEWD